MKINKTVYDALPAELKAAFKQVGATDEFDNGEENVAGLKSALQKEKEEAAGIKSKLAGFEAEKTKEIEAARKKALEEARTTGDFAAIEKDYQRQLKELRDANAKAAQEAETRVKTDAISKQVEDVAKMFVSPTLAKSFIQSRLTAELVDGQPIVRVLGKDGKASAASIEDLKKEYLTDKELKSSLVASRASGGGSGGVPTNSGSGVTTDTNNKFDAVNADPKSMVAHLEAKGIGADDEND